MPVALGPLGTLPMAVFVIGFLLTLGLMARRVRGALLLGILGTTVIAIVLNTIVAGGQGFPTPGAAQLPRAIVQRPDLSTFGRLDFGLFAQLGGLAAVLAIFSMMLSDFFDTMGTVIGVGEKAGFVDGDGRMPRLNRVLLVDAAGAVFGGWANASSNTTYVESAAGVAEGGRTGVAAVVVGVLFLLVGYFMMTLARGIAWDDAEEALPAFVTMLVMPFTWSITNGIGAGFIAYVVIKLVTGKAREVHWMLYLTCVAFAVYFWVGVRL